MLVAGVVSSYEQGTVKPLTLTAPWAEHALLGADCRAVSLWERVRGIYLVG